MKIVAALAILLVGPLFGILVAILLASFALHPDPNFVRNLCGNPAMCHFPEENWLQR